MLHIKKASLGGRLQKPCLRKISLDVRSKNWITIKNEDSTLTSELLRGINGQGVLQSEDWTFLGQLFQNWERPQYRSQIPMISMEPTGWHGNVKQALQLPFQWKTYKHYSWPEERIFIWLEKLGLSQEILTKNCDHLSIQETTQLSIVRAMSLNPKVLLIDDIWGLFSNKTLNYVQDLLLYWLHSKTNPGRALICSDQNSKTAQNATHSYLLTEEGLQPLKFRQKDN